MKTPQDMRFDMAARVEVWVTAEDIADHKRYAAVRNSNLTREAKIAELRRLAGEIVEGKICEAEKNGVAISGHDSSAASINIDRVNWDVLATPDQHLEFMLTISRSRPYDHDTEVRVEATVRLTPDGWEIVEAGGAGPDGEEADGVSDQEQIEEAVLECAEKLNP